MVILYIILKSYLLYVEYNKSRADNLGATAITANKVTLKMMCEELLCQTS